MDHQMRHPYRLDEPTTGSAPPPEPSIWMVHHAIRPSLAPRDDPSIWMVHEAIRPSAARLMSHPYGWFTGWRMVGGVAEGRSAVAHAVDHPDSS